MDFRSQSKITINLGTFLFNDYHTHASALRFILNNVDGSIVKFEFLDGTKVRSVPGCRHSEKVMAAKSRKGGDLVRLWRIQVCRTKRCGAKNVRWKRDANEQSFGVLDQKGSDSSKAAYA